jgi:adenosylcobinamide-GDP ribazoletransferase
MMREFFTAVQFLTRLPAPRSFAAASQADISRAAVFFPIVGAIVGGSAAILYAASQRFLPATTSVLLVLIYMAFVTNAFHEDALADALDGLGGGWSREEALSIMRDSRIGSFGALGLAFLLLVKYDLLSQLRWEHLWRWLLMAQAASRWTALPLAAWLPRARQDGQGQLIARRIGWLQVALSALLLTAISCPLGWKRALLGFIATISVVLLSGLYYRRRLGGVTGDCLGATNQIVEVALYLVAALLDGKRGLNR